MIDGIALAVPDPSDVRALLDRCIAGDRDCWGRLWRLVEEATAGPLRRLGFVAGADPEALADCLQDFYLDVHARALTCLGGFRGTCEVQLRRYLAVVAIRFIRRRLVGHRRAARREARAFLRCARGPSDRDPSEAAVLAALSDLSERLDPRGRSHLRSLLAADSDSAVVSDRSRRRWAAELACHLAD